MQKESVTGGYDTVAQSLSRTTRVENRLQSALRIHCGVLPWQRYIAQRF